MSECRHGIEAGSCADCRRTLDTPVTRSQGSIAEVMRPDFGALWRAANPDDGLGPWISSRWGGRCRGCGSLFEPGDPIRYYEGEDGYLAECCGGTPAG
jgi:hypothetical protein